MLKRRRVGEGREGHVKIGCSKVNPFLLQQEGRKEITRLSFQAKHFQQ